MLQAPSLILEALAAVIVPVLLNAGGICEIFYSLYLLGYSSSAITYSYFPFSFSFTATISSTNRPFLAAYKYFL